jgi:hypothetical protein
MRLRGLQVVAIFTLTLLSADLAAAQASHQGPCAQIIAACEKAGFERGAARVGLGIQVDCLRPLMQRGVQPRRAGAPLSQVDADLIAACRAANPNFGQPSAPPAPLTKGAGQ